MMASPSMVIRPLPLDFARWQDLLDLILRSFAYMSGVIDPSSSALGLTTKSLEAKARAEACFLAMLGPRIAGCAFVSEQDGHLYVGKLAVDPELQGKGIGRALLAAAETLARQVGKPALEVQTRVELATNQAAFARMGFGEVARTAHKGYDRPTSITMRKELR